MRLLNRSFYIALLCANIIWITSATAESHDLHSQKELPRQLAGQDLLNQTRVLPTSVRNTYGGGIDTRGFLTEEEYRSGIKGDFDQMTFEYDPLAEGIFTTIHGGILPHHNVANVFIADFYKYAGKVHASTPYDLVVVISPNHGSLGAAIQVGNEDYLTYEGVLASAKSLAVDISGEEGVDLASSQMLEREHGQLIHMPYIKHYLPETEVLSIVLMENGNDDGIEILVQKCQESFTDLSVLYVASIDFSHYLPLDEAETKDRHTEKLILNNDVLAMFRLRDDYIDSPSTFLAFIKLLEGYGQPRPRIMNHSNSASILKMPMLAETTSYFQVVYE